MVDFIDERFSLLDIEGTRVSDFWAIRWPKFREYFGDRAVLQERITDKTLADWTAGLEYFAEQVRLRFRADRIILHRARWSELLLMPDGTTQYFKSSNVRRQIFQLNVLLDVYFDLFARTLPEARMIEVDRQFLYGDPNHRWSIEPYHDIGDCYREPRSQLRRLVDGDRKPGAACAVVA